MYFEGSHALISKISEKIKPNFITLIDHIEIIINNDFSLQRDYSSKEELIYTF